MFFWGFFPLGKKIIKLNIKKLLVCLSRIKQLTQIIRKHKTMHITLLKIMKQRNNTEKYKLQS